ncbi:ABC transporter substrate-binding protein [Saccharopolyspora griseoalba]|uniref:ABC transporter substrate-binding protein n=1 Tax=Saccharopolyspora griseoalba TaxID=1431848 RepID=A0ABW2LHX1_9PSEU
MRFAAALHSIAVLVLLAGCGTGAAPQEQRSAPGFPRAVDNCGQRTEVQAPPRRVVSLDQGSTEILLALGLADRIAGTATWTDPLPADLAAANEGVPRLADNTPSYESVLAAEPELVTASFEATLGTGGVATREQFAELGVPTYLSPSDCSKDNSGPGDGRRDAPLTMRSIFTEVRDLARMFGVEDRGERLVAELRGRMDRATGDLRASDASIAYWFANSESPYLAGCCGAPGIITAEVGARNAFADTRAEWPQINWEVLAERDPDVLVLGDLTRDRETAESARAKIGFLESHPVTRNMTAVREKRYVLLSGQAMNPTIRTVAGVEKVAAKLREFGMAG